ncbi:lipopolysaccharide biosynthesis protein [Thalassotalea sp. Y01]|uniref:lipopolysaccharide biosynthesis protein n=1 Tax=Thalassotalea sp. Y01 TaxID=2729613 RepID=UPI00145DF34B|nr:lipopolysaccharide biosynthesis protein [Thalassotalea sp. Y01]NMP16510.1 lipopolysaccharide biosynthesis protein [Thalassotalea sp. Y01]
MSSIKNKAVKGVFWSFIDKALGQTVTLLVIVVLARELTPSDFGLVGMLAIFIAISEAFINGGFVSALIQKQNRKERDFSTVFISNIVISCLLYILLYFFSPYIASFYGQPQLTELARVIFCSLILNALYVTKETRLVIGLRFKVISLINITSLIISSICAVALAFGDFGVWALVLQSIIRSALMAGMYFIIVREREKLVFSTESFNTLFSFGSKILIQSIISKLVNNLYPLFIGRVFSAHAVGNFMYGQRITSIVSNTISNITQRVTFPLLSSIQDERDKLLSVYKKIIMLVAFVTFPVMCGLALIAEPFVKVFLTEKWLEAVPIIQWLCLATMLTPIGVANLNILNAIGSSDRFLKASLISLGIGLLILFISVDYGFEALVIGRFITALCGYFVNSYYPGVLFGYGAFKQISDLSPIIVITAFMSFGVYSVQIEDPIFDLIFSILVGAGVYISLSYFGNLQAFNDIKSLFKTSQHKK